MNKKHLIFAAVGVLALVICLSGANWLGDLRSFKDNAQAGSEQQQPEAQDPTLIQEDVGVIPDATVKDFQDNGDSQEGDAGDAQQPAAAGDTVEVVLYFATADGSALEAEVREIAKEEGIARATMNQLIAGPREEDLSATLPDGTRLLDIDVSGGLCTVDLSAELTGGLADSSAQVLALYSIVNTMCQFDTVQQVQILVDGQQLSSVGGVDASQALAPLDR